MLTLNETLSFLSEHGIFPKKGLSQNFLVEPNVVRKIAKTADIQPGETILEIGPGIGSLTKHLLDLGASVIAIEKDLFLAKALQRFQTEDQRLKIYADDALKFPFETIQFDRVVANLPYNITTPLLEKFLRYPFKSLTVMIQTEVADRIAAKEGTKEYGSLSLFIRYYANLKEKFTVSHNCFYPKPSVSSTVIHLEPKEKPDVSEETFFLFMRAAFQKRRKMLSSTLKNLIPSIETKKALEALNLRSDARPEMLSFDEWLLFLKKICPGKLQINGHPS